MQNTAIHHQEKELFTAVQERVSPYFYMYKSFVNYKTYMLVAHRNIISVYDLITN